VGRTDRDDDSFGPVLRWELLDLLGCIYEDCVGLRDRGTVDRPEHMHQRGPTIEAAVLESVGQ
jgi:hypothetical protein